MINRLNIFYIGDTIDKIDKNIKYSTIEECYNYLSKETIVSLDIETTKKYNKYPQEGLDPYTSNIVMLQIGTKERQFVIDYRNTDISKLLPILTNENIVIVGQNLKFEFKHLLHNENIRINNLYDTMIVEAVITNGYFQPTSLEYLNNKYLNIKVDKDTRLEFLNIGNKQFSNRQIKYGAEDVLYPLLIRNYQQKEINRLNIQRTIDLEMRYIEVLGDMEYKGMAFDSKKWIKVYEENLEKYKEYKTKLDDFVLSNYPDSRFINRQLKLFSSETETTIQWASPLQVIDFFKYLKICPLEVSKTTKKLTYTVEAKVLKSSLASTNKDIDDSLKKLIKDYIKFSELGQLTTTFGIDFLKHINPISKRIHSNYKQIVNTGRISSSNPNLQNIPSDIRFRECFIASEGNNIVNADYSGQENILLVNSSLDEKLLEFYDSGETDMHSFNAKMIFPDKLDKLSLDEIKENYPDLRQIAKSVSFALAYGGNGYTIANNLGISLEEGEDIYNSYFDAFPGLKDFFDKTIKKSMNRGFIEIDSLTKRKFFFKDFKDLKKLKKEKDWSNYYRLRGKYERACLNYIIQGAAGSVTKLAGILFRNWILKNNYQDLVFITNMVHDEINVECKESLSKETANALVKCMIKAGSYWCKTVKLDAEYKISKYWTH